MYWYVRETRLISEHMEKNLLYQGMCTSDVCVDNERKLKYTLGLVYS